MWKAHPCLYCGNLTHNPKYCNTRCQMAYQSKVKVDKWLKGEISGYYSTNTFGGVPNFIKSYLYEKANHTCEDCGWNEVNPHTNKVPLCVFHIDGNYKNNRPENLKMICRNCFSLTRYWKGANRGYGRKRIWTSSINDLNEENNNENE